MRNVRQHCGHSFSLLAGADLIDNEDGRGFARAYRIVHRIGTHRGIVSASRRDLEAFFPAAVTTQLPEKETLYAFGCWIVHPADTYDADVLGPFGEQFADPQFTLQEQCVCPVERALTRDPMLSLAQMRLTWEEEFGTEIHAYDGAMAQASRGEEVAQ